MATADELIASLSASISEHTHTVSDSDTYFVIDPITRQVTNTAADKNVLMQYDHNSERFTFELPRYVEGHDMTLCNAVKVHYINIDSETDAQNEDVYDVNDLRVDPGNSSNTICSWLISRNATQYAGLLSFLVQYTCVDGDGDIVYEWHTDIFSDIEIKASFNNGESSVLEYSDVLEQWRASLFGAGDSAVAEIESTFETKKSELQAESTTQQANISAKGEEVLATIPEDYTETHNIADKALRKKADAVILSESGESPMFLDDTSDSHLIGMKLYGRTTQVTTTGKNLLNATATTHSINGGTVIVDEDGIMHLCGTFSKNSAIIVGTFAGSGEFIFSTEEIGASRKGSYLYVGLPEGQSAGWYGVTTTFTDDGTTRSIYLVVIKGSYETVALRPMIRNSSINDSTYESYSGGHASPSPSWAQTPESIENPTIEMYGKNLLIDSKMIATHTAGGITCDYEGDGIFHIHGTYAHVANSIQLSTCDLNTPIDPNRKYTLHGKLLEGSIPGTYHPYVGLGSPTVSSKNWMPLFMNNENVSVGETTIYSGIPKIYLADATHITRFWIYHYNPDMTNYTADFRIQVWLTADEGSEFQPSDEKQTITPSRTLRGIPVDQNGNYTDSTGQQWICDEIDYERGKFIQRVAAVTIDGTESTLRQYGTSTVYVIDLPILNGGWELRNSYCTHFVNDENKAWSGEYGYFACDKKGTIYFSFNTTNFDTFKAWLSANTPTIVCPLINPIETDLTAAELQAFRALQTNATDTSIFNDQNVKMDVKYVADLNRFIFKNYSGKEQKFDINLPVANWVESADHMYYTQPVSFEARPNSRIDLHPTPQQLISLINDGISMFVSNEDGAVTAYCVGGIPGTDFTIRATEQVVVYE